MTEDPTREVTDSLVLAAMSHPLRRRLLDVLTVDGPSTASVLADRTGQTVANVSHHVRVLHGCGLVEEAKELAHDRRERWWRLVSPGLRWRSSDFAGDPAEAAIADAAQSLNLEHDLNLVRAWRSAPDHIRETWSGSAFSTDRWLHLTPTELRALSDEMIALLDRWASREVPSDSHQRDPVFLFAYGVPGQP